MWFNPIMRSLLKSPLHFFISKSTMLLTYQGQKSGRAFTTPVSYLNIDGSLYTISSRDRVWWRNMRAGADVMLLINGRRRPARGVVFEEHEAVKVALTRYLRRMPERAKYFDVQSDQAGNLLDADLSKLAQSTVVVEFQPVLEEALVVDDKNAVFHTSHSSQEV